MNHFQNQYDDIFLLAVEEIQTNSHQSCSLELKREE
jgi:hypothetical protein